MYINAVIKNASTNPSKQAHKFKMKIGRLRDVGVEKNSSTATVGTRREPNGATIKMKLREGFIAAM